MKMAGIQSLGNSSSWTIGCGTMLLNSLHANMDHFDIDAEGKAAKKTWELKEALRRHTASKEFWEVLMSGMVDVTGALCAFVSRRIPKEKYSKGNNPTEFESMLAHAFYYDDRKGPPRIHQHQEYEADHQLTQEKVVLIPHSLNNLYPKMSTLVSMSPVTTEAYLAIPLWQGDICFAQMGLLWTKDGLQKKPPLSWGYLTTFLLGLEEAVQKRLATDISTPHPDIAPHTPKFSLRSKIPQAGVPHCCKISLKPYARNVSHELRTPMQGVIGTLDLLHGSILELSNLCTPQPSSIIESMLQNVELAQDSSMRAVYAADNMVHAYDLDMEVPSLPVITDNLQHGEDTWSASMQRNPSAPNGAPSYIREARTNNETSLPAPSTRKRRKVKNRTRSSSSPPQGRMPLESTFSRLSSIVPNSGIVSPSATSPAPPGTVALIFDASGQVLLNCRPVRLREFLHEVIHECLRIGGRPEAMNAVESELGEVVMITMKGNGGQSHTTKIELSVDYEVPNFIIVDELALKKLLSCVFHNAVKFSPGGLIRLGVSTKHPSSRFVTFSIIDTGRGIESTFLPNLFKPFSREDTSITRTLDGLGLGLLVAKGLARKMGGDLWCEWTSTKGPLTGSEFRVRLPTSPANSPSSLPGTPLNTPGSFIHSNMSSLSLEGVGPLIGSLKLDVKRIPVSVIQPLTPPRTYVGAPTAAAAACSTSATVEPGLTSQEAPVSCCALVQPSKPFRVCNPSKRGLQILVVEDNTINRTLLVSMLLRIGFAREDIFTAVDGLEAIKIMETERAPGKEISLVLMDIWMPNCDGYEATKRILGLQRYQERSKSCAPQERGRTGGCSQAIQKPKILAVSADVTREASNRAIEIGMVGFLAKPYRISDLQRVLREHGSD